MILIQLLCFLLMFGFGGSVAISSEFAIVGASYSAKKAFIFKNTGGTWGTKAAFNLDQNTGDSLFGNRVANNL